MIKHGEKEYPEAFISYGKALEIYKKKVLPSNHPTLVSLFNNIAVILY